MTLNRHDRLRIYPEILAHYMRSGMTDEYVLYVAVKEIDKRIGGNGLMNSSIIIDLAMCLFGVSRKTAYAKLNSGIGVFWRAPKGRRGERMVGVFSHRVIFDSAKVTSNACKPIEIFMWQLGESETDQYRGQIIRDLMTAIVAASHKSISMSNLAKSTGVSYRTAQRRMRYVANLEHLSLKTIKRFTELATYNNMPEALAARGDCVDATKHRLRIIHNGKRWALARREANGYVLFGLRELKLRRRHRDLKDIIPNRV